MEMGLGPMPHKLLKAAIGPTGAYRSKLEFPIHLI
jgi:hypothetical protein